jgi:hypothetical protein
MTKNTPKKQLNRQIKQWKSHDKEKETKKEKEKRLAENKRKFMNTLINKPQKTKTKYIEKKTKSGKVKVVKTKVKRKKMTIHKVKRVDW